MVNFENYNKKWKTQRKRKKQETFKVEQAKAIVEKKKK